MTARMMETKKGGRDDNDHSGHVVQSGNPVPRLAGHQPARKLPIQMSKVKARDTRLHQSVELALPDDAGQGGTNHRARKRSFRHSCTPKVKILRALVDLEDLL